MNSDSKFYHDLGFASGRHKGLCDAFDMIPKIGKELGLTTDQILDLQRPLLEAAIEITYPEVPA